jgi:hypothetical protein
MTTIPRALLEQALEFAADIARGKYKGNAEEMRDALRAALAQQEEEEPEGGWQSAPSPHVTQRIADMPMSEYRRGVHDGFKLGLREGRIKAEDEMREQEPVAWIHKETGLLRREISRPKGADWDANYWQPLYATAQPTAEDIAQDWDLLKETQAALRDAWAILKKLKAVQDAARELVESDPDSAADTEGEAFAAWCALVAAIDDADTLLCEFGESRE